MDSDAGIREAIGLSFSTLDQVINLPKGGGAVQGLAGTFAPDLHMGTGNFTVPIQLPAGRNGLVPKLALTYSTGHGNGPFGIGWSLSLPSISRKTSRGVPRYEETDVFLYSGAEDLVPIPRQPDQPRSFRPRTEGLFARIQHHEGPGENHWSVHTKDGMMSRFGTLTPPGGLAPARDPATLTDPLLPGRVFAWMLTSVQDSFGNRVEYQYRRDVPSVLDPRQWDQLQVETIRYVDHGDPLAPSFLVSVGFEYETADRPDPFSDHRAGFEIRTTLRVARIVIRTHAEMTRLVREYRFQYDQARDNGASMLRRIDVVGIDDAAPVGQTEQAMPPVTFTYSSFRPGEPDGRRLVAVGGPAFPAVSLASPDLQLADVVGDGLPDLLEMDRSTIRYWRNLGDGRFDWPQVMPDAPAGFQLSDPGVQLLDADGDGRLDLLVQRPGLSGFFPLRFDGLWDRRSFRSQPVAPSIDLKDPEVRLIDLDGDGVTDAARTSTRLEFYFQDTKLGWNQTRVVPRRPAEEFPDVSFADPRVQTADMTGDGLTDIVLVHDGNVEYWPNQGHGNFGRRVTMRNSPRFPFEYDPRRVLIGDVNGDGVADLVYVDFNHVTLWVNQSGNAWSDPITIPGTPFYSGLDAVRLVDLLGTGVTGILFSRAGESADRTNWLFLDLTGGVKPALLVETDNHMGMVTRIEYQPSTRDYLKDERTHASRWRTPLPFPVQVVAQVEVRDVVSRSKLTNVYHYRHGYWDGAEREFRGFARVDHHDTQTFEDYHAPGLFPGEDFAAVEPRMFSPPVETRTWFHMGPIGDEFGGWGELDLSPEFWPGDPMALPRPASVSSWLASLPRRVRRDAIRAMRGSVLRTELYARDGTSREDRPYTVTEAVYAVREEPPSPGSTSDQPHIFYPYQVGRRTTEWERGDEPMTRLNFVGDYDAYGQAQVAVDVAVPRGRDYRVGSAPITPYLATRVRTRYAHRDDPVAGVYLIGLTYRVESEELLNDGSATALDLANLALEGGGTANRFGLSVQFYDGPAFQGLPLGLLGDHGVVVRSESLVLTRDLLRQAYQGPGGVADPAIEPPYLVPGGPVAWTADAPQEFRDLLFPLTGYVYRAGDADFPEGYYLVGDQRSINARGLVVAERDPYGHEGTITYDSYDFLAIETSNAIGLKSSVTLDYRLFRPTTATGLNLNRTQYVYSPLGLLRSIAVQGKAGENRGDTLADPSVTFTHDLDHVPVSVTTIRREFHVTESDPALTPGEIGRTLKSVEYSDGLGRPIQTRTQAEELAFGSTDLGDSGLTADPTVTPVACAVGRVVAERVRVNGAQVYDNKGRVVAKYEPVFSTGYAYDPTGYQTGRHGTIFYDPRGQTIRTVDPNGAEQRSIPGVPVALDQPETFIPTPWESYSYDSNDNAGRTHPTSPTVDPSHFNTPSTIERDALGRTVRVTVRNGPVPTTDWFTTRTNYDIRGNPIETIDPLGRVVSHQVFDLANRRWRLDHLSAGLHRTVIDAVGRVVEHRDGKGALTLRGYDVLNRPWRVWARDVVGEAITLRQRFEYGDELDHDTARAANLLGFLHRHFDEAGLLTIEAYDFKGNPVERVRRTVRDDVLLAVFAGAAAASWVVAPFRMDWETGVGGLDARIADLLETDEFRVSATHDAINRAWRVLYPQDVTGHRKVLRRRYDRGGVVVRVELDGEIYVQHLAANARGQQILVAYGNGLMSRSVYDPDTFRLIRQRSERFTVAVPDQYCPAGGLIQDLFSDYDLAGNPWTTVDRTPGSGVLNNPDALGEPDPTLRTLLSSGDALRRRFTHDPLYRLVRATGRISKGIAAPRPWSDDPRAGFNSGRHGTPNQDNAPNLTTLYVETYAHDPAGNLLRLGQQAEGRSWTRHFGMGGLTPSDWDAAWQAHLGTGAIWDDPPGNQLTHVGDDLPTTPQTHEFDANGNLVRELGVRQSEWDYADRMRVWRTQTPGAEPTIHTQYLYSADGARVKKIVRKPGDRIEVAIEIEGLFECFRQVQAGVVRQNNRVRVML